MPLVKNNFLKGKMNKDVDERLVGSGEYIDARNVSILNSTDGNSGSVENVLGNVEASDFGLTDRHLEIIGKYADEANDRIFVFITNYSDSSVDKLSNFAPEKSGHYICMYDLKSNSSSILVGGSFLNFSKTHEVLSVNILEDFLFFTDNRNQPRKINVSRAIVSPFTSSSPYYTREENISVAKYYPWKPIDLYSDSSNGELSVYNSELVGAITQNVDDATNGSLDISIPDAGGVSRTGSGTGAEATIIVESNKVVSIKINISGSGFKVGDTVTVSNTGLGSTEDLIFEIRECDIKKYSTLKDTKSEFLPYTITTTVKANTTTSNTYAINESPAPADINKMYGCRVVARSTNGNYEISHSDNITVVSVSAGTVELSSSVSLSAGTEVIMGANPFYLSNNRSDDTISEEFVRFSYRYIFDDNEVSLMAPFTQHAFIPKQDGHFLGEDPEEDDGGKNIDRDEQESIASTIVSFFENKVTEAGLVISTPEDVSSFKNLNKELKVRAIEILYKSSKDQSIKIIDTIDFEDLVEVNEPKYEYSYKSEKPIRTLPQKDLTRVYDTVPIRAKAQEIIGNRVIYGNILVKSTSPSNLNYSVFVGDKAKQSDDYGTTSKIEYQNSTVKQNRTYQVGIVLADKFGRQSDVILSKDSSVFNKFKSPNEAIVSEDDMYCGDSLKIALNSVIPESYSKSGYIGLYSEKNPLGWYSYKIVVKQQEQSYYNLYVPTLLNGYPHSASAHDDDVHSDLAHITLFGDNINKAPRDLNKISGQDKVFSSSVDVVSRVDNTSYNATQHTSFQNSSNRTYDEITLIGERNEIGLARTQDGLDYEESPFFGIPVAPGINDDINDSKGSNPLIGRMSTNSELGCHGGHLDATSITFERLRLNVLETKPLESALDIFWETTTAGLISELNESVSNSAPEGAVAVSVESLGFRLTEASDIDSIISAYFSPLDNQRNPIVSDDVNMSIVSVVGGGGSGEDFTDGFEIVKESNNKFRIKNKKRWVYLENSDTVHNFKFTFTVSRLIDSELYESRVSTFEPNILYNLSPSIEQFTDSYELIGDEGEFVNIIKIPDIIHSVYANSGIARYNFNVLDPIIINNGSLTDDISKSREQVGISVKAIKCYLGESRGWLDFKWPEGFETPSLTSLIKITKLNTESGNKFRMFLHGHLTPLRPDKNYIWDKFYWAAIKNSSDGAAPIQGYMPYISSENVIKTTYRVKVLVTDANNTGQSKEYTIQFNIKNK